MNNAVYIIIIINLLKFTKQIEENHKEDEKLDTKVPLDFGEIFIKSKTDEISSEKWMINETDVENLSMSEIDEETDERYYSGKVLLISLGGGEDQMFTTYASKLLVNNNHNVYVITYGEGPYEDTFHPDAKLIKIEVDKYDPIFGPSDKYNGDTADDMSSKGEWTSAKMIQSRLLACQSFLKMEERLREMKFQVIVAPLYLHDVCVLAMAKRLDLPVVGVLTSRVGAWWVWAQMGVLPPLSTTAVPLTVLDMNSIWSRAANLQQHYNYMSNLRQQWQVRAMTMLPSEWNTPPLHELYKHVVRKLVLTWDPLLENQILPSTFTIPIGGFASTTGYMTKDVLVPALLNRAGMIVVNPGGIESWIGLEASNILYEVLSTLSYTVLWKATLKEFTPQNYYKKEFEENEDANMTTFIVKENLPLTDILNHPRHRLLISTCGEHDVITAVYYGSPILCIPVTTDQLISSSKISNLGIGETIRAADVTKSKLLETIISIKSNKSYREKARALGEEIHDQPLNAADRLLFSIEHVIRRPNSPRYKLTSKSLPLLQQTNADVYLVIISLFLLLVLVLLIVAIQIAPLLFKKIKSKSD